MSTISIGPRLVVLSGMTAAGKSSTSREIVRRIPNAMHLDRDRVMWAFLYVQPGPSPALPPFEEYVEGDGIFPDNIRRVETFCGPMTQILVRTKFFWRHASKQSYLVLQRLAKENLELGKVVVIDSFLDCQMLDDGSFRRFLDLPEFCGYPKKILRLVASPDECERRNEERKAVFSEEELRTRVKGLAGADSFDPSRAPSYAAVPAGLANIPHLLIDTSRQAIEKTVEQCLEYIAQ